MGKRIRVIYETDTIALQAAGSALVLPAPLPSTSMPPVVPVRTKMTQSSSSPLVNAPLVSSDDASPLPYTTAHIAAHIAALIAALAALITAPSTARTAAPPSTLLSLPLPTKFYSIGHPASVRTVGLANSPLFSPPSGASEAFDWLRGHAQRRPAP